MTDKAFETISPSQAKAWLSAGEAVLVDVREPDEFKTEHIAYATSLPLGSVDTLFTQLDLPKDRKIIFQCLRGKRGENACMMVNARYPGHKLYNLEGGIGAWKDAGLPVASTASTGKIPVIRQAQMIVGVLVLIGVLIGFSGMSWGFAVSGVLGALLAVAGMTGWCALARLLSCMPCNRAKAATGV